MSPEVTWVKGTIVKFPSTNPKHRDLRKIRTERGEDFLHMYFFHLNQAREAGYPDAMLGERQPIEFLPDRSDPERPKVKEFKPCVDKPGIGHGNGTSFLNPYHFIPLVAPRQDSLKKAEDVLEKAILHDRFGRSGPEPGALFSGRVVCRLTTEGPVVIGSEQRRVDGDDSKETEVHPFELPDPTAPEDSGRRRPAIPGSTLRGLISSLVEAASCSAMRVLANRSYTRRSEIGGESPSAVGMLVEHGGVLKLRPMTRSTQEMTETGGTADKSTCRVLLNGYRPSNGAPQLVRGTFLEARRPKSWSSSHQEYWYANLSAARPHRRGPFVIGLDLPEPPIPESERQQLSEEDRARYPDRGILLVLGLDGSKADNLPPTKKHEYFIPYPKKRDSEPLLAIAPEVLDEFRRVARDARDLARGGSDDDFPYLPAGRARGGHYVEPRAGDLVYYEKKSGPRGDWVSHIAYSSIWRRSVPGDLYRAVGKESPDLVPFHPGRNQLTLAERLFGFVEHRGQRGLAGRVRFAHALAMGEAPGGGWYGPSAPMKILATPKPPSPALYFGNNGYLAGRDLRLEKHAPQGRKVYLHHRQSDIEAGAWQTGNLEDKRKLKMRVTPLKTGTRFVFHLDFHNLDREELGLLLYALRPRPVFRHKLGLGKPLGLGRVRIDPLALCFIDRVACYRPEGLFGPKYHSVEELTEPDATPEPGHWPDLTGPLAHRYRHEVEAAAASAARGASFPAYEELVAEARQLIPEQVRAALELVGNPAQVHDEVTYPVIQGQDSEGEHFQWFVANNRLPPRDRKALEALEPGKPLPRLPRHPRHH